MMKPFKEAALGVSKACGFSRLVGSSRWRRERLAILCYHGVSLDDEHEWDPRFYVSPAVLERRLQTLRDGGYSVLPLGEALRRLYERTLPPKSVAITFDDGCFDFYHGAYPLLKKYGFPATVYLTTFYCAHPKPVFGMFCHYLMFKGRNSFRGGKLANLDFEPDLSHEAARMKAAAAFVESVEGRGATLVEKDAAAEALARELGVDYQAIVAKRILQLMVPDEVARVAAEGLVDFQLHTHRHRTPRDRDLFAREIADNRRRIREMIGSDAGTEHFCYPSGDCAPEFLPWLRELGVVSATTCESGLAAPADHPLLLPRVVDTSTLTPLEWESWLLGVSALAARERLSKQAALEVEPSRPTARRSSSMSTASGWAARNTTCPGPTSSRDSRGTPTPTVP
jgi:peptidoglycan/xylan/chitin deacetylase (PgdA/CDA1 family)